MKVISVNLLMSALSGAVGTLKEAIANRQLLGGIHIPLRAPLTVNLGPLIFLIACSFCELT